MVDRLQRSRGGIVIYRLAADASYCIDVKADTEAEAITKFRAHLATLAQAPMHEGPHGSVVWLDGHAPISVEDRMDDHEPAASEAL